MNKWTTLWITFICLCWISNAFASSLSSEEGAGKTNDKFNLENSNLNNYDGQKIHTRNKRTLLLKKKLIGAGLLGLGVGLTKGYKIGHHHGPEVHHVYLSPPPPSVRYVEYVEKPVYIEKAPIEYDHHPWSPPSEPSPVYGSW